MLIESEERISWLERRIPIFSSTIKIETLLFGLILVLAVFSRVYMLGARVMSHDEVNHVVPSFDLYEGRGYRHDPVTHGPLQFHLIALSYFLLGDSDFSSRLPAALFSIATVAFAGLAWRRYLGKAGALLAALFFLISPFSLFYGRYTRNEAFIGLYALLMLWSLLRYLELGRARYLYLFTLSVALHFISKETSFIYAAQALVFLAGLGVLRVLGREWARPGYKQRFLLVLLLGVVLVGAGLGVGLVSRLTSGTATPTPETQAVQPLPSPTAEGAPQTPRTPLELAGLGIMGLGGLVGLGAVGLLVVGMGVERLKQERSLDVLVLLGTLVLPSLAAFPVRLLGFNPLDYTWPGVLPTAIAVVVLGLASLGVGVWWGGRVWLGCAALFWGLFVVFYTTLFTNGTGFLTGLVGSLGYWLSQQGVQRGSQPWYYFALVQLPMYEYLPLVGSLLAWGLALKKGWFSQALPARPAEPAEDEVEDQNGGGPGAGESRERLPIAGLLLFWSLTSLVAFSIAGEKMPWLTYHIAVGLILGAAWAFGYLVESTPWRRLRIGNGWLGLVLAPVLVLSLAGVAGSLLGAQRPFAGNSLEQLQATTTFIFGLVTAVASGWGLGVVLRSWSGWELGRIFGLSLAAILVVLTARTAIRANYINYDTAKEFLVYAHAARGPKDILAQVEEISRRTTGGLDIAVAYDNDGLYPYWWYFRHYPNKNWYGEAPTRELRNNPVIIASEVNYDKMQNIVGDAYTSFEYFRLWWPMQEYFNLTWERIGNAIRNPQMREALARIWLNADYSLYAQVTGLTNLTETTWSPSNKFRMYIRKDIVAQMWNYGVAASAQPVQADPYEAGMLDLAADRVFGSPGAEPGQFNAPRALAVAPDGSLYVADSRNHRIQHLAPDGQVLQVWGSFADANAGEAPAGTFNEPWGVAVAPDGAVYVADTWNNRIQQFTPDGQFVRMWGYFGQAEAPEAFWGPRGVAVDGQGRVYVSDTGNKRVVVFDGEGGYLSQFGGKGFEPGQFDEPVGVAVAPDGRVYVADTWNQRVQVLLPVEEQGQPLSYVPQAQWDIVGWYGQSVENKPYLAASEAGQVFVADPEGSRVLEFGPEGEFVRGWGDFGTGPNGFGLAAGVGVDGAGGVWVADAGNHRIMHFTLP